MFVLAGSVGIWDTLDAPNSLAGSIERVRLWEPSQGELHDRRVGFIDALFDGQPPPVTAAPGRSEIADAVVRGGFPEVLRRSDPRAQRWFAVWNSDPPRAKNYSHPFNTASRCTIILE